MAWELVSPDDIERIEVVRGPASALYGPNAMGGVINIITKKGAGKPSAGIRAGYGSHDSHLLGATIGGSVSTLSRLDFRIGASSYQTDGFIAQPEPDIWGSRDLAGKDSEDRKFNTRLGYSFSEDHEITFGYNYFDTDGAWLGGHPNYRWQRHGYLADIGYKGRISPVVDLKARIMRADYRTTDSFDWDFWGDSGNLDLAETRHEKERVWGGELQADLHVFPGNTITAGSSYSRGAWEVMSEDTTGASTGDTSSRSSVLGLYLQDEQRIGDYLILTIGGRYDRYKFFDDIRDGVTFADSDDEVFNPRAGVRLNLSKTTSFYANAGKGYLPALNTLKFRSSAIWLNNPELKPEKSTSYEIGMNQTVGGFMNARLALFTTDYRDRISAVMVGMNRQFQNIGEVDVKGAEIGLEAVIGDWWRPFANYTFTDAEIAKNPSDPLSEGKRPAFIPKNKFNAGITYDNPDIVTARIAGRYVGERYFDNRNTEKAGVFFVADAKVSKRFSLSGMMEEAEISFAVNNIFDKEYTEFQFERADGRNCWVELSFRF
jgi:TonB-dependent siderophore receptor